jgi:hypothetical protein
MASVEVFVDDAVRGRFPSVCAKTGAPADGMHRIEQEFGGIGAAWLLAFLGPVGWLLLVLVALFHRRELLTVRVPMSRAASEAERDIRRVRLASTAVALGAFTAAFVRLEPLPVAVWVAVSLVALVVAFVSHFVLLFRQIGVQLDASRRWVSLRGVHPAFAAAVRGWQSPDARVTLDSTAPLEQK